MDLQDVPEEYKEIYIRHYDAIKTRIFQGRTKSVYHFLMTENYSLSLLDEYLSVVRSDRENGYKINAAFGFILKNVDTQELKFFHPSNNNTIFELPKRVLDEQDYENLRKDLERRDVVEYANTQRPGTKWRVVKIVCMRFDVYKLADS